MSSYNNHREDKGGYSAPEDNFRQPGQRPGTLHARFVMHVSVFVCLSSSITHQSPVYVYLVNNGGVQPFLSLCA